MCHSKKILIEEIALAVTIFDQMGSFTIRKKRILEWHAESKNVFGKW